jgi:hypothetical protein
MNKSNKIEFSNIRTHFRTDFQRPPSFLTRQNGFDSQQEETLPSRARSRIGGAGTRARMVRTEMALLDRHARMPSPSCKGGTSRTP